MEERERKNTIHNKRLFPYYKKGKRATETNKFVLNEYHAVILFHVSTQLTRGKLSAGLCV